MKLTPRCHAALGLACIPPWTVNAGLVAGDARTLIVDTGYGAASARTLLGYAEALRPANELVAVVTKPHLDVARDADPIAPVSDLFVWGLLIALFELAGARGLTASFGRARRFHPRRRASKTPGPGGPTHTVTFRWRGVAPPRPPAPVPAAAGRPRAAASTRCYDAIRWCRGRPATSRGPSACRCAACSARCTRRGLASGLSRSERVSALP